jgi:hypothetical protein
MIISQLDEEVSIEMFKVCVSCCCMYSLFNSLFVKQNKVIMYNLSFSNEVIYSI